MGQLKIKEYNHSTLIARLPATPGVRDGTWHRQWSGCYMSEKFISANHAAGAAAAHPPESKPCFNEGEFEDFCTMSVIERLAGSEMLFMELGAGFGSQSLDVHGVVKNGLLGDIPVKRARCVAVEAEPSHFRWLQEAFAYNCVPGYTFFGAMSESTGWAPFDTNQRPEDSYGQALFKGDGTSVPVYGLDYLMETMGIRRVDLLHMDIQGEEYKVLCGGRRAMRDGKIDHIIVCPHSVKLQKDIKDLLSPIYDCLVDMEPMGRSLHDVGLSRPVSMPQDGFQLFVKKGL